MYWMATKPASKPPIAPMTYHTLFASVVSLSAALLIGRVVGVALGLPVGTSVGAADGTDRTTADVSTVGVTITVLSTVTFIDTPLAAACVAIVEVKSPLDTADDMSEEMLSVTAVASSCSVFSTTSSTVNDTIVDVPSSLLPVASVPSLRAECSVTFKWVTALISSIRAIVDTTTCFITRRCFGVNVDRSSPSTTNPDDTFAWVYAKSVGTGVGFGRTGVGTLVGVLVGASVGDKVGFDVGSSVGAREG